MAMNPNTSKNRPPAYVKAKPVTPTKPVPIVNSAEERARRVAQSGLSALGPLPGKKAAPSSKPTASKPPQPTAAERAAAQRQNASLRNAKVSASEAQVIARANRSEGSGKSGKVISSSGTGYGGYRPVPKKYPNFDF